MTRAQAIDLAVCLAGDTAEFESAVYHHDKGGKKTGVPFTQCEWCAPFVSRIRAEFRRIAQSGVIR